MPAFLLEVGTEELPATFVDEAIAQWRSRIPATLSEQYLEGEAVRVYATPRRLAVLITGLPEKQADREEEVKGPPKEAAFKDGKPTKAAEGFVRKQGMTLEDLEIRDTPKGEFVFLQKQVKGRATAEILQELVPQWILNLEGKRLMRWANGDMRFSRPIRWLVVLWDEAVLPVTLDTGDDTLRADRFSRGHRVLHPDPVEIPRATDYAECLRRAGVEVDRDRRRDIIREQVNAAAATVAGEAIVYPDLLDEVVNLVEAPNAVVGKFDRDFLELPQEAISCVMVTHQRYFPVQAAGQTSLLPYFITISNGDPAKAAAIAAGNERVIRARLADGQFFYNADLKKPLADYVSELATVTFQERLGSMRQKVDRIVGMAGYIAEDLNLEQEDRDRIHRTAYLCKADLVTQMVYEFPELQGVIGEKYALASNEPEPVARAIFEHYLPRGAGEHPPKTLTGQVVGLADKLDTLVSIFGLGMIPSGSSDPFALRRAANGVVNILWQAGLSLNLLRVLDQAVADFTAFYPQALPDLLAQLQEFFLQRLRTLLQEERGIDYDLVNAVLGEEDAEYAARAIADPLDLLARAAFLQSIRQNGTLSNIYETVNRSARLAKQGKLDTQTLDPVLVVEPQHFEKTSEQGFYDALIAMQPRAEAAQANQDYQQLVDALAETAPVVSRFFDGEDSVFVMDEDPNRQRNRLNLLGLLRNYARVLADFGAIVKG